jgi:hypothetical protein
LSEVVDDVKVVFVLRVQVVVNNFGVVYLSPVLLVSLPFHFENNLTV